jgi:hypothetical protein
MRRLRSPGPETEPPFQINDSWIQPPGVIEAWRERNLKERRWESTVSRSVFKPTVRFSCPGLKYTEPFLRPARLFSDPVVMRARTVTNEAIFSRP